MITGLNRKLYPLLTEGALLVAIVSTLIPIGWLFWNS